MSKVRWLIRSGGPWLLRWTVRAVLAAGLVAVCFVPYSYEIGGECRVVPICEFSVRSQLADEIEEIHVDDGETVKRGDVLASLAAREERASVDVTVAELKKAQAHLDLLRSGSRDEDIQIAEQKVELAQVQLRFRESELQRVEKLHAKSAASEKELIQTRKSHDIAQALLQAVQENLSRVKDGARPEEIRAAEAQVEALQAKLEHSRRMLELREIKSPIDGTLNTPNIQLRRGHMVQPGDLIAVVQDKSKLLVQIAADEAAATEIEPNMDVKIRLRGLYGELVTGHVDRIAWFTEDKTDLNSASYRTDRETAVDRISDRDENRYVRVYVELDEQANELVPGMTGHARVMIERDIFLNAMLRPVIRFARVEIWSWLP